MTKKIFALLLIFSILLGMGAFTASAEETTSYEFPEYGEEMALGEPILGDINMTEYAEFVESNGVTYLMVPAKGGRLYVFNFTDFLDGKTNEKGDYVHTWLPDGIGIPRGIAEDSKGTVYVVGDAPSVFYYNVRTGNSGKINVGLAGISGVTVDNSDNVYVSGKSGSNGLVYKINTNNGNKVTEIYRSNDVTTLQTIVWGGNRLYVQGPFAKDVGNGSTILELTESGKPTGRFYDMPMTGGVYYLSYVGGVVFAGHSAKMADGLVAVDTTGSVMRELKLGKDASLLGTVTNEKDGKAYMILYGDGLYEYDVKAKKLTQKVSSSGNTRNLRMRDGYFTYGSSEFILTFGPSSASGHRISGDNMGPAYNELFTGAYSTYSGRSITPGLPGSGVSVYIGGYLTPNVTSYSPGEEDPLVVEFSNTHAQTDSLLTYDGKVYAGCYSGAFLMEYDPATGIALELVHGLKDEYEQLRIHGLAAGDDKIFFSTVPADQTYGGCIGWYDLMTGDVYVERNVVKDQSVLGIVYDEETDILYGATTVRGGTNADGKADCAVIMAYDVANRKVLGQFDVNHLTGDKAQYISNVTKDPVTGKMWGLVSQTLFSFEYKDGKMTFTEEWEAPTVPNDRYPNGGSKNWFPRPIVFDGDGNLYFGTDEEAYGIMKMTLDENRKIVKSQSISKSTTRIYTVGADGNFYYVSAELVMIPMGRLGITRSMIDNAKPTDREAIREAQKAYQALTEEEKAEMGAEYGDKLTALVEYEDQMEKQAVADAIAAIRKVGAVTVTSGGDIVKAELAYNALKEESKAQVTNYKELEAAVAAYKALCEKAEWAATSTYTYQLNTKNNSRAEGVSLNNITFDHITQGMWEYATHSEGSAVGFDGKEALSLELAGKGWLALRIKVIAAGFYKLEMGQKAVADTKTGVYIFPVLGAGADQWRESVTAEMDQGAAYTEHYIGIADGSKATSEIGYWQCSTPGEYILVINNLDANAQKLNPANLVMSKKDPVTDSMVELAKSRINAIGEITKNSGKAISEARSTYDALDAVQKQKINADALTRLEAEYAQFMKDTTEKEKNEAAVKLAMMQIDSIGTVTMGAGNAITMARQTYDALTEEQKAMVTNLDVLVAAEAAYAQLVGDGQEEKTGGAGWIIAIAAVVVLGGGGAAWFFLKKKKPAVAVTKNEDPSLEDILEQ